MDWPLEREPDIDNVDRFSGVQLEKDLRHHGEYVSGTNKIHDVEVEVPEYIYRRLNPRDLNPSDLKTECAKPVKKAEFDFNKLYDYMALRKLRTIECENNNAKRQQRPAWTSRAVAHSAGCDTGKKVQQPTVDPCSMVRSIGKTRLQATYTSDFLAEDQTAKPIVSLNDCRLQNSNGIKRSGQQLLEEFQSKQSLDRSFGQTRPQSKLHIGGDAYEEEERPQTTLPYVSQLRPQGLNQLDHTKGDQVAAILIEGYDSREIIQKAIHKDTYLVKETLGDPAILGISPENVSCIQMVQLEAAIKQTEEKEMVKYVVIYYSGHFDMNKGFKIDENSFMSNKKFKELLKATKQDIILVTDCCFSGQLQFSEDNIVHIGATGPEERTRLDHSGSIFTKILMHCLKGMKGKDQPSPVTDKFPCKVCKKQKPEEVRNGPISVFSLEANIKAHMMELNEQPFLRFTPFINKSDQGNRYIF